MLTTTLTPRSRIDVGLTLAPLVQGPNDPTACFDDRGAFWRASRTPIGPATVRVTQRASGDITVTAWGEGAAWAMQHAADLVGANDSLEGFAPRGRVAELHRRFGGMRMPRTRAVFDATVPAILGQLVTSVEAYESWRRIVVAWSEPAPGPMELMLPPAPHALAKRSSFDLRAMGVGLRQATAILFAAKRAERLEEIPAMARDAAERRLRAFRGIGPWTTACVMAVALGDADAVPLGDYNLPHTVAWAFTGAPRGDDAAMLELLAPYAGHRGRVLRLIEAAGIRAPRFGPRHRLR